MQDKNPVIEQIIYKHPYTFSICYVVGNLKFPLECCEYLTRIL